MENISLYIADKKVDLNEQSFILYNYATRDLTNPTIVKNSFSKQITLPGTPVNNEVFGNFYRSDRMTRFDDKYTGIYFDPLRKMPFSIYDEKSNLLESGYVKLNSVTRENDRVSYAITLYGELGMFLYNLSYGEEGEKKTLAALDYGVDDFSFPITKDSVISAWSRLKQSTRDMTSLWDFVNFVPGYNGIPEGFTANKAYLPNSDTLVDLSRNYTEWETRELRAMYQNCGMSIKGFFNGLQKWSENNGYQLNLDGTFFNKNNPHYERMWCLLSPMTYGRKSTVNLVEGSMSLSNEVLIEGIPLSFFVKFSIGDLETASNGLIDLSSYDAEAFLQADIDLGIEPSSNGRYISYYNQATSTWEGALIGAQVLVVANEKIVQSSKVFVWGGAAGSDDYRLRDLLSYMNSSEYVFVSNMPFAKAISKTKAYVGGASRVRIEVNTYIATIEDNKGNTTIPLYANEQSNGTQSPIWEGELYMTSYPGKITLNLPSAIESGSVVDKETIFANTPSPSDFLLSYCKQYGLQLQVRNNRIDITTRNNFYNGNIIDASDLIDVNSIQITPMPFEKRRCKLSLSQMGNYYEKQYEQANSKSYGEMVVDTGYQFNNEEENLFSSSVFKGGVSVRESGGQYNNYKDASGSIVNPALLGGYTQDGEFILQDFATIDNANNGVDPVSKICSYSYDGENKKALKSAGVLLFFNGMKETQIEYYVSNQFKAENAWVLFDRTTTQATKVSSLPEFSRYWSENDSVKYSLDFGTPKEVYDATINITPESSLYERYWKGLLQDQFDIDARVMKCKVNLSGIQVGIDLMKNFFYYDNAIWVLDKISNYSVTTDDLTECEFVKVKDIKNYTNGQTL